MRAPHPSAWLQRDPEEARNQALVKRFRISSVATERLLQ